MPWYFRLMHVLNWAFCFFTGLFLVLVPAGALPRAAFDGMGRPHLLQAFQESTFKQHWILIGTSILILEVLMLTRSRVMRAREILLKREGGDVKLKVAAVEGLLSRVAKAHPSVIEAKVRVAPHQAKAYRVRCELTVLDSPDFHEVLDGVRQKLRRRFLELVPKVREPRVDVYVAEIIRDTQRAAGVEETGPAYAGPQYPVEGEELPAPPTHPAYTKRGK